MAKGITESDVHAAADALVAAGERPTVERIRAHLGTGSPNTVTRWLDSWWRGLGARLAAQQARLAAPAAPDEVAALAGQWWERALAAARTAAQAELATAERTLADARAALASERAAWQTVVDEAVAERASADQARGLAEARLQELQRQRDGLDAQLDDSRRQRDHAVAAHADVQQRLAASQADCARTVADAASERQQREAAHRATEDRWLQEVDRARLEVTHVTARLQQRDKALERAATAAAGQEARLIQTEKELIGQRVRAETLERQLEVGSAVPNSARGRGPSKRNTGKRKTVS